MPEGDTVHRLATALRPLLEGRTLCAVRLHGEDAADLVGRRVEAVESLGKHLLVHLQGAELLRSHLGMGGSWHRYRPGETWQRPAWQASLVLGTDADVLVCFGAREVERLPAGGRRDRELRRHLGPDLLGPDPIAGGLVAGARALLPPDAPLSDVLLDQRVAAGIGNVYRSELLFLAGLHPAQTLAATADDTLLALYRLARDLLLRNLGGGRRATRPADGLGPLWVYARTGRSCLRCGTPICRWRGGRNLRPVYWCPVCQPAPAP